MMIYIVSAVDDPQGITTKIEANTAQEAAKKWAAEASYPNDSQYSLHSLQGWVVVRVCAAAGSDLGTFQVDPPTGAQD